MPTPLITPNPVDLEQAIEILSNLREPNFSGMFFLETLDQPMVRHLEDTPRWWVKAYSKFLKSGIVDRWLCDSMNQNIPEEGGHMINIAPAPKIYHVPRIHLSTKFLHQVGDMGKDSLVFFFMAKGLSWPEKKLVVRHTLRDIIVAMIEEARHGYSSEFCGAMLRSIGLEFFAPNTRRKDWVLMPVEELKEDPDYVEKVWRDSSDPTARDRPMIEILH